MLVLVLGWYSLRIAAVIGDGVAVVGRAVVIGVLPGVGYIISALKIGRKNNSRVGPGGVTSQPRRWSPVPTIVAPPGCCSRCHSHLSPVVVAVVSVGAAPREPLVLSFQFPLHTRSLLVNKALVE